MTSFMSTFLSISIRFHPLKWLLLELQPTLAVAVVSWLFKCTWILIRTYRFRYSWNWMRHRAPLIQPLSSRALPCWSRHRRRHDRCLQCKNWRSPVTWRGKPGSRRRRRCQSPRSGGGTRLEARRIWEHSVQVWPYYFPTWRYTIFRLCQLS